MKLAFEGPAPTPDEIAAIVATLEAARSSERVEPLPAAPVSRWRAAAREEAVNS